MKFLLIGLILLGSLAPMPKALQEQPDFKQIWDRQLETSCKETLKLEKSVFTDGDKANMETLVFALNCEKKKALNITTEDSVKMELKTEVAAAMEFYFAEPRIKDYFKVETQGNKTSAVLLEEFWDKTPLKEQQFFMEPNTDLLNSVYCKIEQDSWFYNIEIEIRVNFDKTGNYSSHEQTTQNKILFFDSGFMSTIWAKTI